MPSCDARRASKGELRKRLRLSWGLVTLFLAYPVYAAADRLLYAEGDPAANVVALTASLLLAAMIFGRFVLPDWLALRALGEFPDLRVSAIITAPYQSARGSAVAILLEVFNDDESGVSLDCWLNITDTSGNTIPFTRGLAEDLDPQGPPAHFAGARGWLPLPINISPGTSASGAIGFLVGGWEGRPILGIKDRRTGQNRKYELPCSA